MKHYTEFAKDGYKPKLQRKAIKDALCEDIFTFDIETTSLFVKNGIGEAFDMNQPASFYQDKEKLGFCYIWQFSINDVVYYGRYLSEFKEFIEEVTKKLKGRKMVIYVHNLAFEFQFLRDIFTFTKVLAREVHKPFKALVDAYNLEFRCSYVLTNMSLAQCANSYKLPVKKHTGDLDYLKVRTPETPLTLQELDYCEYDCLVLYHLIKLKLKEYNLKDMPTTQTGYVRLALKESIKSFNRSNYALKNWRDKIATLSPDYVTFTDLVRAYAGGYTHANSYYTGDIIEDVNSYDFTSSYPAVIIQEKFPCTRFSPDRLDETTFDKKAYLLKIRYNGIRSNKSNNYISYNKCEDIHGAILDNGRVSFADTLSITMTEQDYITIEENYDYDSKDILMCKSAVKRPLPREVVMLTINLFDEKNKIKAQIKAAQTDEERENLEVLYVEVKQRLNSIYGMMVTNYIKDECEYNPATGEWEEAQIGPKEISEKLREQETKSSLMLPYQWGVWVSAYARRNLWSVISQVDALEIYSDTDSIKCIGDITSVVDAYNKRAQQKNEKAAKIYKVDRAILGKLGEFDHDGSYKEFVTLGAKKYAYKAQDDSLHITISGVNKRIGVNALQGDIRKFKNGLFFGYEHSGKNTLFYNDAQTPVRTIDTTGKIRTVKGLHGICLMPTTYKLGMTQEYLDFCGANYLKNI